MDQPVTVPPEDHSLLWLQPGIVNPRKQRKNCLLSEGERKAIEPFKNRYKSEISREKRLSLAKSEIFSAYFNYLHSVGQAPNSMKELEEKTKVWLVVWHFVTFWPQAEQFLVNWLSNNWRFNNRPEQVSANTNVCPIDIVWRQKRGLWHGNEENPWCGWIGSNSSGILSATFGSCQSCPRWVECERETGGWCITKIKEKGYDEAVQKEFVASTVRRSLADFDETLD